MRRRAGTFLALTVLAGSGLAAIPTALSARAADGTTIVPEPESAQIFLTGEVSARPGATITLKLPAGVGIASTALFSDGDDEGGELKVVGSGSSVKVTIPAKAAPGAGGLLLDLTKANQWPHWDTLPTVGVDVKITKNGPAAPSAPITGTAFAEAGTIDLRPGVAATVSLASGNTLLDELTGVDLTNARGFYGPLLTNRSDLGLEDGALGLTVNDDHRSVALKVPSSYPVDHYPANEDAPYLVVAGTGTGSITDVSFYVTVKYTRADGAKLGLVRATPDGQLSFNLPAQTWGTGGKVATRTFGKKGDVPLLGNWDGSGVQAGVYRPSTSTFYLKSPESVRTVKFGSKGDVPVTGRFVAGLKRDVIGVYRPSTGTFHLASANVAGGGKITTVKFGKAGDEPLVGNWNGAKDGVARVGVYRPSARQFLLSGANVNGGAGVRSVKLGSVGDLPLAGDWDGDGTTDVGLRRPSTGTFILATQLRTPAKIPTTTLTLGRTTDIPLAYTP